LNCHRTLSSATSVVPRCLWPRNLRSTSKSLPVPIPTGITVMVMSASMMVRRRPRSGANAAPVAGRIGAGGVVCPPSAHADDPAITMPQAVHASGILSVSRWITASAPARSPPMRWSPTTSARSWRRRLSPAPSSSTARGMRGSSRAGRDTRSRQCLWAGRSDLHPIYEPRRPALDWDPCGVYMYTPHLYPRR
jgi:hypothetical protein